MCVAIDRESDKEEQVAAIQQELAALGSAVQTLGGASQAVGVGQGRAGGGGRVVHQLHPDRSSDAPERHQKRKQMLLTHKC